MIEFNCVLSGSCDAAPTKCYEDEHSGVAYNIYSKPPLFKSEKKDSLWRQERADRGSGPTCFALCAEYIHPTSGTRIPLNFTTKKAPLNEN